MNSKLALSALLVSAQLISSNSNAATNYSLTSQHIESLYHICTEKGVDLSNISSVVSCINKELSSKEVSIGKLDSNGYPSFIKLDKKLTYSDKEKLDNVYQKLYVIKKAKEAELLNKKLSDKKKESKNNLDASKDKIKLVDKVTDTEKVSKDIVKPKVDDAKIQAEFLAKRDAEIAKNKLELANKDKSKRKLKDVNKSVSSKTLVNKVDDAKVQLEFLKKRDNDLENSKLELSRKALEKNKLDIENLYSKYTKLHSKSNEYIYLSQNNKLSLDERISLVNKSAELVDEAIVIKSKIDRKLIDQSNNLSEFIELSKELSDNKLIDNKIVSKYINDLDIVREENLKRNLDLNKDLTKALDINKDILKEVKSLDNYIVDLDTGISKDQDRLNILLSSYVRNAKIKNNDKNSIDDLAITQLETLIKAKLLAKANLSEAKLSYLELAKEHSLKYKEVSDSLDKDIKLAEDKLKSSSDVDRYINNLVLNNSKDKRLFTLNNLKRIQSTELYSKKLELDQVKLDNENLISTARNSILSYKEIEARVKSLKTREEVDSYLAKAKKVIDDSNKVVKKALEIQSRPVTNFSKSLPNGYVKFICENRNLKDGLLKACINKTNSKVNIINDYLINNKITLHKVDVSQTGNKLSNNIANNSLKSYTDSVSYLKLQELLVNKAQVKLVQEVTSKANFAKKSALNKAEKEILAQESVIAINDKGIKIRDSKALHIKNKYLKEKAKIDFEKYTLDPETILGRDLVTDEISFRNKQVSYKDYFVRVFAEAGLLKSKKLQTKAALEKNKAAELYYLPVLSATSTYKYHINQEDNSLGDKIDTNINLSSTVISDSTSAKIKESNSKLAIAELNQRKEEEKLAIAIISNIISIEYYGKLRIVANKLASETKKLYNDLKVGYDNGVSKESDLRNADLLYQRIITEIAAINRESESFKSNIEEITGISYPEYGILLPDNLLANINKIPLKSDIVTLSNNVDIKIAQLQADQAKYNAEQQRNLYSLQVVAQQKFKGHEYQSNDTYLGVQLNASLFDYNASQNVKAGYNLYLSQLAARDFKVREIKKSLDGLYKQDKNNTEELKSLILQKETTDKLISSQEREYQVNSSTFYQMLNTKYDLFITQKNLIEKTVVELNNKLKVHQAFGGLLEVLQLN